MADATADNLQSPDRPKRRPLWLLKRLMIYLLLIYCCWLLIGCAIQRAILFPRSMAGGQTDRPADAQLLTRPIDGGNVEAWFIPGDNVSAQNPGGLVIFAHGNGELIDHWPDMLEPYRYMGFSILLPEFRGYGRSAGKPSQKDIADDYRYFYDQAIQRPEVDPDRIILHGRSLGGGVISQLAKDRPSAVLILQSSPASIKRMAGRFLVPPFLVLDPFDTESVVEQYQHPILIMHGKADNVIPPSHAQRLADVATNPKSRLLYYESDHNTVPPSATYWQDIEQFLKDADVFESQ